MTLITSEHNLTTALGVEVNPRIILQHDADGITELQKFPSGGICNEGFNLENTCINVQNSSDVIVGPVTQFNGSVTIYQNVAETNNITDGLSKDNERSFCDTSEYIESNLKRAESLSPVELSNTDRQRKIVERNYLKFVGTLAIVLMLIIGTIAIFLVLFNQNNSINNVDPNPFTDGPNPFTVAPYVPIGNHYYIDRERWGGRPSLNFTVALKHPTTYVIISHTAGPICKSVPSCSSTVLSIQQFHVGTIRSPDIGYNFLIGGDANVYIGRGWDTRNFHMDDSIGICFIGNYLYDNLTTDMIETAQNLLQIGVDLGKLNSNYRLIPHNQTYATESPGPNIYNVIKEWPHFVLDKLYDM